MKKLLIVEDHELTRAGLELLFFENKKFKIVKFLDHGQAVIPFLTTSQLNVDIVILDLDLPDMNGVSLLAELIDKNDMTVLVLTGQQETKAIQLALDLGASAVVSKADDTKHLIEGLIKVNIGQIYKSPTIEQSLKINIKSKISLSPRQMSILHFLAIGETNKEIGYKLGIAAPTVSFHLSELRTKLNVANNKKIVAKAHALGLL